MNLDICIKQFKISNSYDNFILTQKKCNLRGSWWVFKKTLQHQTYLNRGKIMCEEFNLTKEQKEKQKELFNGLYAMTLALSENIDDVVLNTKIYSVEDVLDENFWVDFTDDICEMNIIEYVKPVIKQVYNILNLYKKNPDYKNFKEDYWKKIYNYKEIDYNKPISYKTFKEVVASTPAF